MTPSVLGPMLFWFIAIAVTAIACAALYAAAGGKAAIPDQPAAKESQSHFRQVLAGIDADLAAGKLGEPEAIAAKGELAREMLRLKGDADSSKIGRPMERGPIVAGIAATAVLAFGVYAMLGHPQLPSQPLAGRPEAVAQTIDLKTAIEKIEAQLVASPDDLRGWTVIAPAYVELGRFSDAAKAYRKVLELGGPSADTETRLAEVLFLEADGAGSDEAMRLLRQAADRDPKNALSRLYLAAELTRTGQYAEATPIWQAALALSTGNEPWLGAARQGLAAAQNDGVAPPNADEAEMIAGMVSGLADRLEVSGGSVEEWTQLVRAYLVLGDTAKAQAAYDKSVAAYPQTFDRGELDTIALSAGLKLNGATP